MIENNQEKIDSLITDFFAIFDNRAAKIPDFAALEEMFILGASIIKRHGDQLEKMSVPDFILPRKELLTNGSLVEFHEWEIAQETFITMGLATRICTYGKQGLLNGAPYAGQGEKHIQLILTVQGWKIASILWEDKV